MPQLRNSLLENIESLFGKIELQTRRVSVSQFHTTINVIKNNVLEKNQQEETPTALVEKRQNFSKQILSVIPEDFIKLYKVFPLKYEKNNLVLGMVNPLDEMAINQVVLLTGLKPLIQKITLDEFKTYIKKFL